MTAEISNYREVLYTRDYSHDVPPEEDPIKRIGLAAIPFLSLHKVLRYPISVVMGTLRVGNTEPEDFWGTVVAVIALAATIFRHHLGMMITAIHDVIIEMRSVQKAEKWEEVTKSLVKILSQLLYLALLSVGGLELSVIAFAAQAVVNLIQSGDEFKSGRWLEGVANLLMAGARLHQSYTQYQQLPRNGDIEAETLPEIPIEESPQETIGVLES